MSNIAEILAYYLSFRVGVNDFWIVLANLLQEQADEA